VSRGWVADLAGVLQPTQTELIKLKFVRPRKKYNDYEEFRAAVNTLQRLMTCLVEVKTSRADFVGDKKWKAVHVVDLAYLAVPRGLIKPEEWPAKWGILEYNETRDEVKCIRTPEIGCASMEEQRDVILGIAIRRDHHTRYERAREFQRERRIEHNESVSRTRAIDAMRAMKSIVDGQHEDVEGALRYHGVKAFPGHFMKDLKSLWAISGQTDEGVLLDRNGQRRG